MKILLYSHWFSPSFGGVETVSKLLAEEFTKAGATVTVVTNTPGPDLSVDYAVVRRPSRWILRGLATQADVIIQNTISLRTLFVMASSGKPIVIAHHSWLRRSDGSRGIENYLKLAAVRFFSNVSISRSIAEALPVHSIVIGDPFESHEFAPLCERERDRDIVYMGRLIPEKGCDLLLYALGNLKAQGLNPTLTVIGDGPEMVPLKALTSQLGLTGQVDFLGALGNGRGEIVARHKVMVIPSRWAEPFGIVALEGIACGCAIVASSKGGLPDAVGNCGVHFPNGDIGALGSAIRETLSNPALRQRLVSGGAGHLQAFEPAVVARKYLDFFETLLSPSSKARTAKDEPVGYCEGLKAQPIKDATRHL